MGVGRGIAPSCGCPTSEAIFSLIRTVFESRILLAALSMFYNVLTRFPVEILTSDKFGDLDLGILFLVHLRSSRSAKNSISYGPNSECMLKSEQRSHGRFSHMGTPLS